MKKTLEDILLIWPNFFITSKEIRSLLGKSSQEAYVIISRAAKKQLLSRIKNGLFIINPPYRKKGINKFELAQNIYGPSYVSLESALSYHGWIPEAVYVTTSVSSKKIKHFDTSIGCFRFYPVSPKHFLMNVERVEIDSFIFLLAEPWRAVADYIYVHQKKWKNVSDLYEDLRIEKETVLKSNLSSLNQLRKNYPYKSVRKILSNLYQELKDEK